MSRCWVQSGACPRLRRGQIKLELKFLESDSRVVDAFRRRGMVIPLYCNRLRGEQGRRNAPKPMGPLGGGGGVRRVDVNLLMASCTDRGRRTVRCDAMKMKTKMKIDKREKQGRNSKYKQYGRFNSSTSVTCNVILSL
jgi:hypothetical protein